MKRRRKKQVEMKVEKRVNLMKKQKVKLTMNQKKMNHCLKKKENF
jgi:hypothetical protein